MPLCQACRAVPAPAGSRWCPSCLSRLYAAVTGVPGDEADRIARFGLCRACPSALDGSGTCPGCGAADDAPYSKVSSSHRPATENNNSA